MGCMRLQSITCWPSNEWLNYAPTLKKRTKRSQYLANRVQIIALEYYQNYMPRCTRLFFLFHSRFQFRQLSDRSKPIRACDEFSLAVSHLLASSRSCVYQRLSSSVYVYDCIGQLSTGLEKVLWNVSNAHGERGQLNDRAYVFYFFRIWFGKKKRETHTQKE